MTKNEQINKSLELEFQIEFETLGNILGDYLLFLELKAIEPIKDPSHIKQIRQLLDCYAEQFDKILSSYRLGITNDIKELTRSLLIDLEKQTTTQTTH